MKKGTVIAVLSVCCALFLFNFHILRLNDGIDIIAKDHPSFRDCYVDVRHWGLADYISRSPRIRNYLIFEKKYLEAVKLLTEHTDQAADTVKTTLRELVDAGYRWLSEKLR